MAITEDNDRLVNELAVLTANLRLALALACERIAAMEVAANSDQRQEANYHQRDLLERARVLLRTIDLEQEGAFEVLSQQLALIPQEPQE